MYRGRGRPRQSTRGRPEKLLEVDAALGLGHARPSAGPRVLTGSHAPGARLAADRRVVVPDQWVHQDAVLRRVAVDVILGPPGERADLDLLPLRVPRHDGGVRAGRALVTAYAAAPGVVVGEH